MTAKLPHLVLLDLSPFHVLRLRLDPVVLFVEALKHGAGDFGAAWPMAAISPGMGLIFLQTVGVGLHNAALFQE